MNERDVRIRTGLGLAVIAATLLLLPLLLNVMRGGARGVGFDPREQGSELLFAATYPTAAAEGPLDGRLVIVLSRDTAAEPRLQVEAGPPGQQVLGLDVEGWLPGRPVEVTDSAFGFPLPSLAHVPAGHYRVQAVLDRYENFRLGSGEAVKLPAAPGGSWNLRAGNLVSRPVEVYVDPRSRDVIRLDLARTIAPPPTSAGTDGLPRVRLRSERLSAFWGRDVFLEATVEAPDGWSEGAEARLPVLLVVGADGRGPRAPAGSVPALVATLEHRGPFPAPWQATDSENLGPWGEAVTHELVPEIERRFGGRGPAARALVGVGLGAWEALATLIAYPDDYAGAWAVCPGPVDFRAFGGVDLYHDRSAYHYDRAWGATPRPGAAAPGRPSGTLEQENHLELALATRGRSGGPWDAWQALLSPRGADGYPRFVWDKRTGRIDPEVVAHWRENHDLLHVLERDWGTLGPKLAGKLHVYAGGADLTDPGESVGRLAAFLEGVRDPAYAGEAPVRGAVPGRCAGLDPAAGAAFAERVLREAADRLAGAGS